MVDARRAAGVLAAACLLVLSGCSPDQPAGPSPSPTPVVQTPTETAQEQQQPLDYAAAEAAYRTFRGEYNRVLRAGGAKEPTKLMKATAGGDYLSTFVEVIQGFRVLKSRSTGEEMIAYVRGAGYRTNEIVLDVCEDDRNLATVRESGKSGNGDLRTVRLTVRKVDGRWKVWSGAGKVVTSCG